MGTQYFCQNERRRQALQGHATLNGIDYLEVLHGDAPVGSPPQRTLLVHFVNPLTTPLNGGNVRIEGGVRVTPVGVTWADHATNANDLFTTGRINEAERDFLLALLEADQILVVRTDEAGDFSTYRLRLVTSPTQPKQPDHIDPILSTIDFSFKVECPSDFDCQIVQECPPEAAPEPAIDYLAKDYASFRKLILDRLAVIMPDWQERNPADLGIALVEVLAYAGDYLSYFQDAAATEAYLGTARRRISMRRHARLLDYPMHDGVNARAWVAFGVNAGGDGLLLPQYDAVTDTPTRLLTKIPLGPVIAEEQLGEVLGVYDAEVFELMQDVRLYTAHNAMQFYTWGDEECCLPKGATRATLQDNAEDRIRLRPGDILILMEQRNPVTGLTVDAGGPLGAAHRHAVRLTHVHPEAAENAQGERTPGPLVMDELFNQPIVEIEWEAADALPFALCLSTLIAGSLQAEISVALGNVALADHGLSIAGETIAPPSGHRKYRPRLQETSITHRIIYDHERALTQPAMTMLLQNPRAALPAVYLRSDGEQWAPQRDLLASDRFATEFVVEMESDGHGYLRFGDGAFGRDPTGVEFQAAYRIGNGTAGNVGADAIAHVVTGIGGLASAFDWIRNPLPAAGGTAPEAIEEVRLYAPQAFRTQERAVTEADYAAVAERHPEVQKAVATRRWTGSWYTIFVTVDRKGGGSRGALTGPGAVDVAFESELRRWLERFRLTGHDLEIDAPRFVALDIVMTVCVKPGYFKSDVKEALLNVFSNRALPNGQRGFFHPDNFTFGQPVYLSQIIATAMDVPGVQWIDVDDKAGKPNRFRRWGKAAHGEIDKGVIELARIEIARLDNDPSLPENGKIDFVMQGGL